MHLEGALTNLRMPPHRLSKFLALLDLAILAIVIAAKPWISLRPEVIRSTNAFIPTQQKLKLDYN